MAVTFNQMVTAGAFAGVIGLIIKSLAFTLGKVGIVGRFPQSRAVTELWF